MNLNFTLLRPVLDRDWTHDIRKPLGELYAYLRKSRLRTQRVLVRCVSDEVFLALIYQWNGFRHNTSLKDRWRYSIAD